MSDLTYLLAVDQGTTSSRAMLFDKTGHVIAQAQEEIHPHYPQPAWVEQDPNVILSSVLSVCRSVLSAANVSLQQIAGMGISNQRETTIIWDRTTGEAIYPAIVWQDRRTSLYCEELIAQGLESMVTQKTGLLIDPYFSATKIHWVLHHIDGAKQKAMRGELAFGTVDSYLLWHLTGGTEHATDITNAARTLLLNIHTGQWDEELLALFDIPRSLLPTVKPNTSDYGYTAAGIFERQLPIVAMVGDQQAASIGQGCFLPGMIKSTYGTGCFLLLNTGNEVIYSKHRLLSTIAYQIDSQITYALEGSIFMAGATIQWLRDAMKFIHSAKECEALIMKTENTGGVYLVPAFTGMGAPYWDADARGAIVGLTRDTDIPQIVRAAVEAVCYQTRDIITAMREDGAEVQHLRVDGGMAANQWFIQFLADILNIPVMRPPLLESTAVGVAYLVGVQQGLYPVFQAENPLWQGTQTFNPKMSEEERESHYKGWLQAVSMILYRSPMKK
jgi:glycerol kinase